MCFRQPKNPQAYISLQKLNRPILKTREVYKSFIDKALDEPTKGNVMRRDDVFMRSDKLGQVL